MIDRSTRSETNNEVIGNFLDSNRETYTAQAV